MKIVVLDGFTLNPGDLSWERLQQFGTTSIYDRTPPGEVVERAAEAEIVLTNKTVLSAQHLEKLPRLRYIGVLATGYNVVDVAAARLRGVTVTNVPAYGTASVAQLTFALLLELTMHAGHHAQTVRSGRWTRSSDFCYWDFPLVELNQLTLGVIGFGRIGRAVAALGASFGMNVLAQSRSIPTNIPSGVRLVNLESIFRQCDVLTLHCPLTPETQQLVNRTHLGWMKPSAFLLNTSRGGLIEEAALAEALNAGRLAGAGLDVLSLEPPPFDNPLLTARNCLITPHIAWATGAARSRLMDIAMSNLAAFAAGQPRNVVS
jgi:glycerate dehydrogenase